MRAAMALAPLLNRVWHADELPAADVAGTLPSGYASLDAELPGGGWPLGALTELLLDAPGCGELSLLMPALARCGGPIVWVLPHEPAAAAADVPGAALPYAPALAAAGIDPARNLFVAPATPRESLWALEQSLRAPQLGALIGWLPAGHGEAEFRALRRLHLLAGRQRALVFALREARAAAAPSPAALRLQLTGRDGSLEITLLKRRGRPLLAPIALQVHPPHWNGAHLPASTAPVPAPLPTPALAPALPARRWSLQSIFSH
jgi:hypothetical protein